MAQSATVLAVTGRVLLIPATGEPRVLAVGDTVQAGDTVRPAAGASVQLGLDDGQTLSLTPDQALLMGADAPVPADPAVTDAVQAVLDVLERGGDLDELEAAAAGLAGGGGGNGSSFVRLLRISEAVSPLEYEYGTELAPTIDEPALAADGVAAADEGDGGGGGGGGGGGDQDLFPYTLDDSAKVVIRPLTDQGELDARWKIAGKGNLEVHMDRPQLQGTWMVSDASFKDGLASLPKGSFTVEDSGSGKPNEKGFVVTPIFQAGDGDTFAFKASTVLNTQDAAQKDSFEAVLYQYDGDKWNAVTDIYLSEPSPDGVYSHNFDTDGTYRVAFVVDDVTGGSDSASANIELLSTEYFSVPGDTSYLYQSASGNLFGNDSPGDGDLTDHLLSFDADNYTYDPDTGLHTVEGEYGTLVVDGSGNYVYTPDGDGMGHESFTYTLTDTDGDSSSATLGVDYEIQGFDWTAGHALDLSDMVDYDPPEGAETEVIANALSSYLDFDQNGDGHAVITVDANGDGVPDGLQTSITLNGISLDQLYAYTGLDDPSEVELIDHLLKNGNLHIDD